MTSLSKGGILERLESSAANTSLRYQPSPNAAKNEWILENKEATIHNNRFHQDIVSLAQVYLAYSLKKVMVCSGL